MIGPTKAAADSVEDVERLKWEAHERECEAAAMAALRERKRNRPNRHATAA